MANRLLAALFVAVSLHLGELFLWVDGLLRFLPHLGSVSYPFVFLVGPLYFFYVRRLLDPAFALSWRLAPHAIPALVVLISTLPSYSFPVEAKVAYFEAVAQREPIPVGAWILFYTSLNSIQNLVYLVLSLRLLARAQKRADHELSDGVVVRGVRGLRRIAWGYQAYVLVHLALFLWIAFQGSYHILIDAMWLLAAASFVHVHGWAAVARPESVATALWHVHSTPRSEDSEGRDPGSNSSYERSRLDGDRAEALRRRLETLMREDRLYLSGSLTLKDVADRLGVSRHVVSQLLTQIMQTRFFDFVNDHRIEEAKTRLLESPRITILEVALESGFNSKSTFNEAFRSRVGMTPSAFRNERAASSLAGDADKREGDDRPDTFGGQVTDF